MIVSQWRRRLIERIPERALRPLVRIRNGETSWQQRIRVGRRRLTARSPQPGDAYLEPMVTRGTVRARTVDGFDAHEVHMDTAAAITDSLARHGVPFVVLAGPRGAAARVVVPRDEQAAALSGLRADLTGAEWALELSTDPPRKKRSGSRALSAKAADSEQQLRVYRVLAARSGVVLAAEDLGCDLEFWDRVAEDGVSRADGEPHRAGTLLAPRPNQVVTYLSPHTWSVASSNPGRRVPVNALPSVFEVREPIDIVYTWVDGDDPEWLQRKAGFSDTGSLAELNRSALHESRFASRDELKYSLRSVAMYASWARKIFLVTDRQVPEWLDTDHPKIEVVDHREIFVDPDVLPVFNSHAIESQLHHIPGLSEHYLYLNDDFFFARPVEPELFFHGNGVAKFFPSPITLDVDPASNRDLPVMSAAKRNRALIEERFGATVMQKIKHTPQPQLRSVLEEMERRHPDVFAAVARSRFRHPGDVSIPSALAHYYAYCLGKAVPGEIEYKYHDIKNHNTKRRLDGFLRSRDLDVFCLNDNESDPDQIDEQRTILGEFFEHYYPLPSPYELTTDRPRPVRPTTLAPTRRVGE